MVSETALQQWRRYARALGGEGLPCALVDLGAFDRNAAALFGAARAAGKTVRLATKSVRVPALLRRLQDSAPGVAKGLLTFTAAETAHLAEQGFDDLLLAYPTLHPKDAALLARAARKTTVAAAVDDLAQVQALAQAARSEGVTLGLVVDVDVSWRPLGARGPHLGVRRSPLREAKEVVALAKEIAGTAGVRFRGLLAYEAQVAGLADALPGAVVGNFGKRLLKRLSQPDVSARRSALVAALREAGLPCDLVDGGGTGNLAQAARDPALTEVAAGSGFFASHLFTSYAEQAVVPPLAPALFFALQVTRAPGPGFVTCHGGGLIASGGAGPDRLPQPALPPGLSLLPLEGAGEVQTPLCVPAGVSLPLGAAVFFRPAKAGEPLERFNEVLLIEGARITGRAPTYRGLGHAFL